MTQAEIMQRAVTQAGGVLALSRLTGLPHGQISNWQSEKTAMGVPTLLKILKATNLTLEVHEIRRKNPHSDRA